LFFFFVFFLRVLGGGGGGGGAPPVLSNQTHIYSFVYLFVCVRGMFVVYVCVVCM
jgi:hypothetical protein